jgi:BioD-like phosphotransacetylase family protein
MDKLIIGSICQSTGKTSLVVGLAKTLKKKIGYTKPLGDRMLYRKKRLWDYDSALITNIFGLEDIPDDISIGFDHSKLRFMYDEKSLREKLDSILSDVGKDKDIVFIEGGKEINYGISVYLDVLSIASYTGSKLVLVVSGNENAILDDLTFLKKRIDLANINFGGVILNKIPNLEEFKDTYLPSLTASGLNILGMIPFQKELTTFSVGYLAERLFAKVVSGEDQLHKVIENVFIGTMHVHAAQDNPCFKEENKVVITSGDRTDMILASLDSDAACVVLTGNIFPSAKIVAAAKEKNIPLLLVPADTFQIARQMDVMEPLLTKDDHEKIDRLERLVQTHLDVEGILAG